MKKAFLAMVMLFAVGGAVFGHGSVQVFALGVVSGVFAFGFSTS